MTKARVDDMRRIILIAENCEPLKSKIKRRSITQYDQAQAWLKGTLIGVGMLLGALKH